MRKQHWWILVTYIIMQVSAFAGLPLLYYIGVTSSPFAIEGFVIWSLLSFFIALVIILTLANRIKDYPFQSSEKMPLPHAVLWIVLGVFLAFIVQGMAGAIELSVFKIEPGSENTAQLVTIAKSFPVFFLVFTIFGPILEEIVFRKIIFGSFYKRFNFLISVLLSSVIFGIVHGELAHLLIYTAMGATFAFLYVKTKRLIVPIVTHMLMNTFAGIAMFFSDEIEQFQNQLQFIIGGF